MTSEKFLWQFCYDVAHTGAPVFFNRAKILAVEAELRAHGFDNVEAIRGGLPSASTWQPRL